MLALGFYTVLVYPTNLTWWSFLLALFISFSFALPIGIIEAVTNTQIGLNVLTEFIYGYIQPGRPLALMLYGNSFNLFENCANFWVDLRRLDTSQCKAPLNMPRVAI